MSLRLPHLGLCQFLWISVPTPVPLSLGLYPTLRVSVFLSGFLFPSISGSLSPPPPPESLSLSQGLCPPLLWVSVPISGSLSLGLLISVHVSLGLCPCLSGSLPSPLRVHPNLKSLCPSLSPFFWSLCPPPLLPSPWVFVPFSQGPCLPLWVSGPLYVYTHPPPAGSGEQEREGGSGGGHRGAVIRGAAQKLGWVDSGAPQTLVPIWPLCEFVSSVGGTWCGGLSSTDPEWLHMCGEAWGVWGRQWGGLLPSCAEESAFVCESGLGGVLCLGVCLWGCHITCHRPAQTPRPGAVASTAHRESCGA